MKKKPTPKPQTLSSLPNIKVGTVFGQYYEAGSFEYGKVKKIESRTYSPDGPTEMVVYFDTIRFRHNEIYMDETWVTETRLKMAFDSKMTVILTDDDWAKLHHQATLALQGLKARMEQTLKAALTDIINPHTPTL